MYNELADLNFIHPSDIIDPELVREPTEEELRILCKDYIKLLVILFEDALKFIEKSENPQLALAGVAFALGLTNLYDGKSMGDVSIEKGYSRGAVSRYSLEAQKFMKTPTPYIMKEENQKPKKKRKKQDFDE